jgi:hypothetical protein
VKTVVAIYRKWELAARRGRAWLYRHAWRSAVPVVLVFSLIEPLGCLAHCQFWLSFSGSTVATAQPVHHHNHSIGFDGDRATVLADSRVMPHDRSALDAVPLAARLGVPAHLRTIGLATQGDCFLNGAANIPWRSTSESSPPHEHLAALLIITGVALVPLVRYVWRGSPPAALLPAYRPPLRPPITRPA